MKPYKLTPHPLVDNWTTVKCRASEIEIGRLVKDGEKSWAGRYYYSGGGLTHGGFTRRCDAADFVWDNRFTK